MDGGAMTKLVDINLNLDDKLRREFGNLSVGDEKEFSMMVTVLAGYCLPAEGNATPSV
jgi:hypothetical protein